MMRRMPTFIGGVNDLARYAILLGAGFEHLGSLAPWRFETAIETPTFMR
jgi:hypothetical protein